MKNVKVSFGFPPSASRIFGLWPLPRIFISVHP